MWAGKGKKPETGLLSNSFSRERAKGQYFSLESSQSWQLFRSISRSQNCGIHSSFCSIENCECEYGTNAIDALI
ncbi:AKH_1a_G0015160.mRNA.1.CDS.1 [Saccharomyces cerevisiae]|nr:CEQ_1a_G0014370.mRNA.1.CDS.1 [Saccharomyces cerevisiae]CAI4439387.1 AKH_1a_G0015160.mRNA.1.CDS.1 [Saccharomyces cerevisiae]CAI6627552.1 AKH_1a_G0015160.mRNA.1.CDS.1 [Saccharomyces cerevisiae]CAI7253329.1 CEQ_1a_G0014370.mRNA.1.CDS.1 [Saccharomyces cerevisiae]